MNLTGPMKKMMGWCPNAAFADNKEDVYRVSYEGKYIDKIKGLGFRGVLGALHLVFAAWLIFTAIRILAKPMIFP